MPTFTTDWANALRKNIVVLYANRPTEQMNCVEVGSFEGRGALIIHEHLCQHPDSRLVCIDPFFLEYTVRFFENTAGYPKISAIKGFSQDEIPLLKDNSIDFSYIDGNHSSESTYLAARDMIGKMKKNGIILFDDYLWVEDGVSPKEGIDRFVQEYSDRCTVILKNYQLAVRVL